ncbi:lipopolysaccharide-induced tumor necrosis factor-alpha factor-like [Synchiropus splendidus]|uniref:lipopolysaccharide-induced tumor necrosis factor-alpha factor-like n=1 Tax=Synchiropus splendidus TaxID=270530 RepID=UPI00237D3F99|nr:lipopolysaccharide-induced tumor necrosis factor-alpha factor-like [Synchiropus splendidus]
MDPPTYEEARLHPPVSGQPVDIVSPPPSYDASLASPPTPPPSYGEAVTQEQNPFPILTPPQVQTTVTSAQSRTTRVTVHPTTFIGVVQPPETSRTQPRVVTSQPRSGPSSTESDLRRTPSTVHCPHCQEWVTTDVTCTPQKIAWVLCFVLIVMGFICGVCLFPFCTKSLQNFHHHCPQCGKLIYTYKPPSQ